jgi:sugar/nucleoside kinase (ribokinase family)
VARILVVGDVVDDIGVRPLRPVTPASDTPAEIRMTPGGSAANVAAWIGHLGGDVVFVGRAGAEGVGRHTAALSAYGVDARIASDDELPTASLVLLLDEAGERTMYVDRAANTRLTRADVATDVWHGTTWLHLTGYTFFDPATRPVALQLVEEARTRGAGISVDPGTVSFLRDVGAPAFHSWVSGADLLFPNAEEAAVLGVEDDPRAVLKLGPEGVRVRGVRHPARPATVVDTTGAGDSFCAGYLRAAVAGERDAVEHGLAAAARCVSIRGARPD